VVRSHTRRSGDAGGGEKGEDIGVPTGKTIAVLQALAFGTLALGCSSSGNHLAGTGGRAGASTETITVAQKICQPGSVPVG
jgi:hypothetical protein